jgi:serine/threonine-protein kinase
MRAHTGCAVSALYEALIEQLHSSAVEATAASVEATAGSSASSYAILAKLATGGMAELFLARTASSAGVERYVVLKRVLPERLQDHDFVAMFLDEARLAAQLQHPNIAQVFDTGKLGESFFFSMEYVHGETVRELMNRAHQRGEPIPIGCTLTIAASAAAGLHHAHERLGLDGKPLNIVHRDVSPSNLMVSYEGNIKVVDFGVAKAAKRSVETERGTVKGKIGYLSPEQCRGRAADRRSDLFSLGVVIWELLVGDRLYKRDNDYASMEAIVLEPPVAPSSRRPEVPPALDAIVVKLLAKAPGDRYQTADELYDELERVAEHEGIRISTAALKRHLAELFGKRPEPWIELQARDAVPEVITVSARMTGPDTTLTVLDSALSHVLDLTTTRAYEPATPRSDPAPIAAARASLPIAPRRSRRGLWAIAVLAAGALGAVAWTQRPVHEAAPPRPTAPPVVPVSTPPPTPPPASPVVAPVAAPVHEEVKPHDEPKPHNASHAHRPSDVLAGCHASKSLSPSAAACTLAACQAHDRVAAAWFTHVPAAKRVAIAAQCATAGAPLEPPAVTPATAPKSCDDPMECRK